MLSLLEVEAAAEALPPEQQQELVQFLTVRLHAVVSDPASPDAPVVRQHILDVPTVNLGGLKIPFSFSREELFDEMMEGRL